MVSTNKALVNNKENRYLNKFKTQNIFLKIHLFWANCVTNFAI